MGAWITAATRRRRSAQCSVWLEQKMTLSNRGSICVRAVDVPADQSLTMHWIRWLCQTNCPLLMQTAIVTVLEEGCRSVDDAKPPESSSRDLCVSSCQLLQDPAHARGKPPQRATREKHEQGSQERSPLPHAESHVLTVLGMACRRKRPRTGVVVQS